MTKFCWTWKIKPSYNLINVKVVVNIFSREQPSSPNSCKESKQIPEDPLFTWFYIRYRRYKPDWDRLNPFFCSRVLFFGPKSFHKSFLFILIYVIHSFNFIWEFIIYLFMIKDLLINIYYAWYKFLWVWSSLLHIDW